MLHGAPGLSNAETRFIHKAVISFYGITISPPSPAPLEGVDEMGSVEFWLEEEGIVAFVGVDGDVHAGDAGTL